MIDILIVFLFVITGIFIYTLIQLHFSLTPKKIFKNLKEKPSKINEKILTTKDGIKIFSWYFPIKNPKAFIVLIHGYYDPSKKYNGKESMFEHSKYLNKNGYSTLLLDLRSFGKSKGNKISLGTKEWQDIEAGYDFIKSLPESKDKKIGLFGVSMGAVSAIITKGKSKKGDFVIALTPYESFESLFDFQLSQKRYPTLLFLPFLKLAAFFELGINYNSFSPINLINKMNVPIFIASATNDEMVNKNDAKNLFTKASNPKELWKTESTHDIYLENPKELEEKILNFLSKYI